MPERKTLLTAAGPNMETVLERFSLPLFERFAETHNYAVEAHSLGEDSLLRKDNRAIAARWQKIGLLRKCLEKNDVVAWFDADVMIARRDEDIADHLAATDFQGLVLHNVPAEDRINPNTGVWLMRNSPQSFDFLDEVEETGIVSQRWADQAAAMQVLDWQMGDTRHTGARMPDSPNYFAAATSWLPTGWNQPYVDNRPNPEAYVGRPLVENPHAVHFMAMTITDRLTHMETLSNELAAEGDA